MNEVYIRRKLEEFLLEDLGHLEVSYSGRIVTADIVAEEEGILCGGELFEKTLNLLVPEGGRKLRSFEYLTREGGKFAAHEIVRRIDIDSEISRHGIRTALNLLMHLSGIATKTRKAVEEIAGLPVKLLDTRKTTPGLRVFEKYAVRVGGGKNHRFGRFDGC